MNTKGNQRTVATGNRIKYEFLELLKEKSAERITVSEICGRAEIHRTTFYAHYQDVRDLMEHLIQEMYEQIMGYFVEDREALKGDGFLQLFRLVKEHRAFFQSYLELSAARGFEQDFLPAPLKERVEELVPVMGFTSAEELYYHQTFFSEGLAAVIRRWIARDCRESPEQMSALIAREYLPGKEIIFKG